MDMLLVCPRKVSFKIFVVVPKKDWRAGTPITLKSLIEDPLQ